MEDLRKAGDACPAACRLIVMGDLNINFGFPWDEREEVIADLSDKINLVNVARRF
jgi:hypothetical protein